METEGQEKAAQAATTSDTASVQSPAPSESAEGRWLKTRETVPSEPGTPMVTNNTSEDPFTRSSRTNSITSPTPGAMNIDAEDEDVKIAIIALGAMKHLDGESRSRSLSQGGKENAKTSTSSAMSGSSVNSTAISSPSLSASTLGTELTHSTVPSTSSPPKSFSALEASSGSYRNATTLADLPHDFPFPAIVHDEQGNEMRVDREDMADDDFLKRVSHLPIVRGTLKAYELGKQKSRVVRYGGDFVESSVKAISRPVVSRLGARLGGRGVEQLDDFACRQLDRIYPASDRPGSKEERQLIIQELDEKERTEWKDMTEEEKMKRRRAYWALRLEEKEREMMISEMQRREARSREASGSGSSSAQSNRGERGDQDVQSGSAPVQALVRQHNQMQKEKAVSTSNMGTGWGSMLVEAGVTAGGLSAAMSEESMKSLKYCLQWLQYATAHIEHQITILRDLIVKLNHGELDLSSPASQNLAVIKGDVVNTIRGVVDVVSKYAGGALPEPARASVKAFILSLPARWARVNRAPGTMDSSGRQGSFGGSPASPSFSSAHGSGFAGSSSPSSLSSTATARQQAAATAMAANRVLTLAVESLDILRSVTVVFGESLDRADLWVERLRVLGLQRKRAHEQAAAEEAAAEIDMGMGGVVARGNWESNRGYRAPRGSLSPGADSNMSVDTTASVKRRRTKRRTTTKVRSTPSPKPAISDDELVSDEGSQTETEKANLGKMAQSSSISVHHQHHLYQGNTSHSRKTKGKGTGRLSNKGSSASNTPTPMLQNLSLQDNADSPSRSKH